MKIVLWIGSETNQVALANRIDRDFPVSGIVIEKRKHKRSYTIPKIFEKLYEKLFLNETSRAWSMMLSFYSRTYPEWPDVETLIVENINSEKTIAFTNKFEPDLVMVSGTRMIKEPLLSMKPKMGILNLHTGLSPYIKGGPNCTNWCIATDQFHLIGNTVMWINKGIDSGNIVATELTGFNGEETLTAVQIKVMERGHGLYLRVLRNFKDGFKSDVPQNSIAEGKTYYTKEWRLEQKILLNTNFKKFKEVLKSKEYLEKKSKVTTITF